MKTVAINEDGVIMPGEIPVGNKTGGIELGLANDLEKIHCMGNFAVKKAGVYYKGKTSCLIPVDPSLMVRKDRGYFLADEVSCLEVLCLNATKDLVGVEHSITPMPSTPVEKHDRMLCHVKARPTNNHMRVHPLNGALLIGAGYYTISDCAAEALAVLYPGQGLVVSRSCRFGREPTNYTIFTYEGNERFQMMETESYFSTIMNLKTFNVIGGVAELGKIARDADGAIVGQRRKTDETQLFKLTKEGIASEESDTIRIKTIGKQLEQGEYLPPVVGLVRGFTGTGNRAEVYLVPNMNIDPTVDQALTLWDVAIKSHRSIGETSAGGNLISYNPNPPFETLSVLRPGQCIRVFNYSKGEDGEDKLTIESLQYAGNGKFVRATASMPPNGQLGAYLY